MYKAYTKDLQLDIPSMSYEANCNWEAIGHTNDRSFKSQQMVHFTTDLVRCIYKLIASLCIKQPMLSKF